MDHRSASTADLLKRLIGARQTRRLYLGSLQPLFSPVPGQAEIAEACLIARELVQRWLAEELTTGPILTSPKTVRDYLRIHYAGREYESFSVLFLDAQHLVIDAKKWPRNPKEYQYNSINM
jgi:DNA repair protein RadC